MVRKIFKTLGVLVLLGVGYTGVSISQDVIYWQRWFDIITNLNPAHMNFHPTHKIFGQGAYVLPKADEMSASISSESLRAAEAYAASYDSFAFIVVHKGVVQTEWYGPGWGANDITQSQSMHKTIAALMVGIAIEDGSIGSLNDPLSIYLSEWENDPRGDITIKELLTMSSGLEKYYFTLNPFAAKSAFRFLNTSDREPVLLSTELIWEPGTKYEYNDANAALIGLIIRRATGKSYAEFLDEKLWIPMGGQEAQVWLDDEAGLAMTACCLLAPAMDWARIGMMFRDNGLVNGTQIVSSDFIEQMITPMPHNGRYGLFTWLGNEWDKDPEVSASEIFQSEPYLANDVIMLLGHGGQRVWISREQDLIVVRLGPHSGFQPLKPNWDNAKLMNTIIRGVKP